MNKDTNCLSLPNRPRRNRKSPVVRAFARETELTVDKLVYPLFIQEGSQNHEIDAMPGCFRLSMDGLLREANKASQLGVRAVVLFPAIHDSFKTPKAQESYNDNGLVPKAIRAIKSENPEMTVITDVALDPYSSDGHDGIVAPDGRIVNDETVHVLCKQALCHANAGADIIAPSDMMDGRIGAIRYALDESGFQEISLLSYTAKYASAFYGPFRNALDSAPRSGDKKTYQMDPTNVREALREAALDEDEGADIIMVKPAGPYLDVIRAVKEMASVPVAAYQVSGEYLMIKSASASGWIKEDALIIETLTGIRRAGADLILTYFACAAAKLLLLQK